jgi:hypothetical protein
MPAVMTVGRVVAMCIGTYVAFGIILWLAMPR